MALQAAVAAVAVAVVQVAAAVGLGLLRVTVAPWLAGRRATQAVSWALVVYAAGMRHSLAAAELKAKALRGQPLGLPRLQAASPPACQHPCRTQA